MTVDSEPKDAKDPDAIYPHHFTPELLETMARAYDAEDAAQRGEMDPWSPELGLDPVWAAERIIAMACAVEAMMEAVGKDAKTATGEARKELVSRLRGESHPDFRSPA